eukprot:scaffold23402_cov125-Isochrysis_galbana.AAC.3
MCIQRLPVKILTRASSAAPRLALLERARTYPVRVSRLSTHWSQCPYPCSARRTSSSALLCLLARSAARLLRHIAQPAGHGGRVLGHQVLPRSTRLVLCFKTRRDAGGDGHHKCVGVNIAEIRQRLARGLCPVRLRTIGPEVSARLGRGALARRGRHFFLGGVEISFWVGWRFLFGAGCTETRSATWQARLRRIDDAVRCGEPLVVGPPRHQIAQVDDEGVFPRRHAHVDPLAVHAHGLKPAWKGPSQPQDGQGAVVCVGRCAHLSAWGHRIHEGPGLGKWVVGREEGGHLREEAWESSSAGVACNGSVHLPWLWRRLLRRIVDGADNIAVVACARGEPARRQSQGQGAHVIQPRRQRLQLRIVLCQGRAGARRVARRPADGRNVGVGGRGPNANVEHLFDVAWGGVGALVQGRLQVLGAHGLVAIRVIARHCNRSLLRKRQAEEGCRRIPRLVDHAGRHPMVDYFYKADLPACSIPFRGHCDAVCLRAAGSEERGERNNRNSLGSTDGRSRDGGTSPPLRDQRRLGRSRRCRADHRPS